MNTKTNNQRAFTIVELLTVMSIMVLLISILVPGLNKVRRFAKEVNQKAQLNSIKVSMDLFNAENEEYPPSTETASGNKYSGALKLAEAMIGQDKLGFHPESRFYENGQDSTGERLYNLGFPPTDTRYKQNLKVRKEYLDLTNANAYRLRDIYQSFNGFDGDKFVLCDVFTNVNNRGTTGKNKIGMPILYYRANKSKSLHDVRYPAESIYNYLDNDALVNLGIPWSDNVHPMASASGTTSTGNNPDPQVFYDSIKDEQITSPVRPVRTDSYILMSAGFDGEYGTSDDIFNF